MMRVKRDSKKAEIRSIYGIPFFVHRLKYVRKRKNGSEGCNRYIISNSEDIFSVLFVFALFRWCLWEERDIPIDIIPLFESMEMALSYYRLIPESVYAVTSVSSLKPYRYTTPVGEFIYRKIKPELYFGHDLLEYADKRFKMATIEKALLDYFYLNPHISEFDSLRMNAVSFWEQINEDKLFTFLEKFSQKRLSRTINQFWKFMKNA